MNLHRYSWAHTSAVVLVWAFMLATAFGLIGLYGTKTLPQADELWALHDAGPGFDLPWLWRTWAEHRIPIAKLIWKSVLEATDYDFRAGDWLTVLILAGGALAMIWAARKTRGETLLSDAFFPLALLNFAQATVFLWWWQVNHVLAPTAAGLLLILFVRRGNEMSSRNATIVAAGLVFLSLSGPGGLPYVMVFAVWLGIWAFNSPAPKSGRTGVFVLAGIALTLTALYFVDYTPHFPVNDPPSISSWPPSSGLLASAIGCLQILGASLGAATKLYSVYWGLGVLVFGLATAAVLMQRLISRPDERSRVLALLLFLGANAGLVLMIGRSRAGMGVDYIYSGHYLTLTAPALCCMYFAWELFGGASGRTIQYAMVLILAGLLPANLKHGVDLGRALEQQTLAFERDVRKGYPPSILAERHFASDVVPRAEQIAEMLREHKRNGIGLFKEIQDDPASRVEPLSLDTAILTGMMTFATSGPRHVYAIRLRYVYLKTAGGWPALRVYWRNSAAENFTDDVAPGAPRMHVSIVAGPDQPTWALVDGKIRTDAKVRTERTLTVWVDTTIDQVRLYPDFAPSEMRLSRIELLVP